MNDTGLTSLAFPGGSLLVSAGALPQGARVRVRVHASDASVATEKHNNISTLNVFPGTVRELVQGPGPQADVLVDVGVAIWARITRRSARDLGLAAGAPVFALIKAVAIDRDSVGATALAR